MYKDLNHFYLRFSIILFFIYFYKINEDFKKWFNHVDADSLLLQWDKIQMGIFKVASSSKNTIVIQILESFNENLHSDGKLYKLEIN